MNGWTVLIYGVAAVLALQGLFALMTAHRKQALNRFYEEEIRRKDAEPAQSDEPETAKTGQKVKAA